MNIHQVSVSYVFEQDRLLVRINGEEGGELRVWLTRRLALGLIPLLSQAAGEQIAKVAGSGATASSLEDQRQQLIAAFEKEAALRQGDFQTPYKTQAAAPGDEAVEPEPLLLTEVKITLQGNGQLRLQMSEKLPNQDDSRNLQVMMDAALSNGLLQLLHQSLQQSRWLEAPPAPFATLDFAPAGLPDATEAAELTAGSTRPKYLN